MRRVTFLMGSMTRTCWTMTLSQRLTRCLLLLPRPSPLLPHQPLLLRPLLPLLLLPLPGAARGAL